MKGQKKILLVSHDLLLTGAPVALHYAARCLKNIGYFVVVLAPRDGLMRKEIVQDEINVLVDGSIYNDRFWLKYARNFDLVVVNTLVQYPLIAQLQETNIPILWWIHEASDYYEKVRKETVLPRQLSSNIYVACVGAHAMNILIKNTGWKQVRNLIYCVPDFSKRLSADSDCPIELPADRNIFLLVGTVERRKGQDILADAIIHLSEDELKKVYFVIVGSVSDVIIYQKLLSIKQKYPESICLIERLERKEMQSLYRYCDCVLCTSRDDPMPVTMTEAMIMSKTVICSENTGTAALIKDGENGFIYKKDSWQYCLEKLRLFMSEQLHCDEMGKRARKTYEDNFAESAFEKNIENIVKNLMECSKS